MTVATAFAHAVWPAGALQRLAWLYVLSGVYQRSPVAAQDNNCQYYPSGRFVGCAAPKPGFLVCCSGPPVGIALCIGANLASADNNTWSCPAAYPQYGCCGSIIYNSSVPANATSYDPVSNTPQQASPSPPPPPPSPTVLPTPAPARPVGAIVGGVVGGLIAGGAALVLVWYYCIRHPRARQSGRSGQGPEQRLGQQAEVCTVIKSSKGSARLLLFCTVSQSCLEVHKPRLEKLCPSCRRTLSLLLSNSTWQQS